MATVEGSDIIGPRTSVQPGDSAILEAVTSESPGYATLIFSDAPEGSVAAHAQVIE